MGLRIILDAMRNTPIEEMEKIAKLQPLASRPEYKAAIQGVGRGGGGEAEELDQLSLPPETSAWNQISSEKEKFQAQVEGTTKGKCWSSWGRSKEVQGAHTECLDTAEELSEVRTEILGLAAKGNTGSRTAESAHTGDEAGLLSLKHLHLRLYRWLRRELC